MNTNLFIIAGIAIIFIGIIFIFLGTILQPNSKHMEVKTGGIIMLGPIPIIFGNDKGLIITGVIFAIIMIFYYFMFYRNWG